MKEGARFGKLVIVTATRGAKNKHPTAICRCDCGRERRARQSSLRCSRIIECAYCAVRNGWKKRERASPEQRFLGIKESEYRCNARAKKLEWTLDRPTFQAIFTGPCIYCGVAPANGVDRRDNREGYNIINAASCCSQCNFAKRDQTLEQFEAWLNRIVRFRDEA